MLDDFLCVDGAESFAPFRERREGVVMMAFPPHRAHGLLPTRTHSAPKGLMLFATASPVWFALAYVPWVHVLFFTPSLAFECVGLYTYGRSVLPRRPCTASLEGQVEVGRVQESRAPPIFWCTVLWGV